MLTTTSCYFGLLYSQVVIILLPSYWTANDVIATASVTHQSYIAAVAAAECCGDDVTWRKSLMMTSRCTTQPRRECTYLSAVAASALYTQRKLFSLSPYPVRAVSQCHLTDMVYMSPRSNTRRFGTNNKIGVVSDSWTFLLCNTKNTAG